MRVPPVLSIMSGTAGAQLLTLAATPLLLRWYSPADFGVMAITLSVASIAAILGTLRLELVLPLARGGEELQAIWAVSLLALGTTSLVQTLAIALLQTCSPSAYQSWMWGVPILSTAIGVNQLLNALNVRSKSYTLIAYRAVVQAVVTLGVQITWLLQYPPGAVGLVLGLTCGQVAGSLVLMRTAMPLLTGVSRRTVASALGAYADFIRHLLPAGLLNAASINLPVVLIGAFFGANSAGHFGLTQRILGAAIVIFGQSYGQVYLGQIASITRQKDWTRLSRTFRRTSRSLSAGALVMVIVISTTAPDAFEVAFGPEWRTSGRFAQAMSAAFAMQLVVSPISQTLIVLRRSAWQLSLDVGRVLIITFSILICFSLGLSVFSTVAVLSFASSFTYGFAWLLCKYAIERTLIAGPPQT